MTFSIWHSGQNSGQSSGQILGQKILLSCHPAELSATAVGGSRGGEGGTRGSALFLASLNSVNSEASL